MVSHCVDDGSHMLLEHPYLKTKIRQEIRFKHHHNQAFNRQTNWPRSKGKIIVLARIFERATGYHALLMHQTVECKEKINKKEI